MVRPIDQEITAIFNSQFLRRGGKPHHSGPHGEAPGSFKRQKEQGVGGGGVGR